jgi:catechol 2,3-dioxygenase-like lactoylglutathione lyase family enzyme
MLRWDHAGIKAADVERSLHFYCDILGLRKLETVDLFGRQYHFVGNDSIQIEIEEGRPTDVQADMATSTGLFHLALEVEDLDGAAERLLHAGVTFVISPCQHRPDRRICFFRDPDGVFIQMIQYVPTEGIGVRRPEYGENEPSVGEASPTGRSCSILSEVTGKQ